MELEKKVEKSLIYLGAATVITIALGSLIINLRLFHFKIADYDLVQPHAVMVGLAFSAYIPNYADVSTPSEPPVITEV